MLRERRRLSFRYHPRHRVRFGNASYNGPWKPTALAVVTTEAGRSSIWLASHHQDEFPSVIEKLDAGGAPLGQFWNAGTINAMEPILLAGRQVMLAGGANNDSLGATLVAIDVAEPDGAAPAVNRRYECDDCPRGSPLAYFVFPPTDIQRALGATSTVQEIRVGADGTVTVLVASDISGVVPADGATIGAARYVFDAQLKPLRASIDRSYRLVHDELYRRGLLDHSAGPLDERDLWPILQWDGVSFREVYAAAAR